jgi:23S rRNA pseudouridine2605 synthase
MIGRLDLNTQGLLMFTTDGELARRLMHPAYEIEREYAVRILGEVTPQMLINLKRGVKLDDGVAKFSRIKSQGGTGANTWYSVVINEGRNREVRRLWESQGVQVSRLMRTRFATVSLPTSLRRGAYDFLSPDSVLGLMQQVGLQT